MNFHKQFAGLSLQYFYSDNSQIVYKDPYIELSILFNIKQEIKYTRKNKTSIFSFFKLKSSNQIYWILDHWGLALATWPNFLEYIGWKQNSIGSNLIFSFSTRRFDFPELPTGKKIAV